MQILSVGDLRFYTSNSTSAETPAAVVQIEGSGPTFKALQSELSELPAMRQNVF